MHNLPISELTIRARDIFRLVVEGYLSSGQPVGSKTLAGAAGLNLSAASIRSVLHELEQLGLLAAPHTSAGRLPTEVGLRLFVDSMMQVAEPTPEERAVIERRMTEPGSIEAALAATSSLLSDISAGAGVVMVPRREPRLQHLQLVPIAADRALAVLAVIGMLMPVAPARARESAPLPTHVVRDVELRDGGLLVGRIVDANGRPVVATEVTIISGEKPLASTRTDAEGVFAVAQLRGGVHAITTSENVQVCRLWAPGTAPPQAPQSIELVNDANVARGQYGPPPGNRFVRKAKVWATNPWIVGGVVAAAIAIPVALSDNDGPSS